MRLGIIGCGLIGQKRAAAVSSSDTIVAVADVALDRAEHLAAKSRAKATADPRELLDDASIDIIVVATPHNQLATLALAAIESGKHVLLEKPGARRPAELDALKAAAAAHGVCVHVGFNHRFHPALRRAYELVKENKLGPLYYIRGRYGHGGRIGYDQEWRSKPEISGGGELLDQGAHLIDLSSWYFGAPFVSVHGVVATYFWDMPVEDNAFLTLRTSSGMTAQLQVTWTEWKNLFSLEIVGRDAKLHIEGLGGSYGVERLAYYAMKAAMGPPDTTIWEYPGPDQSWADEWKHFCLEIERRQTQCEPGLESTQAVLGVVEQVYKQNHVQWVADAPIGAK
jgi:predicted dehydrogenase